MDKEPFLELIEEKKDNDSDIDIEKQIYEQQTKVRNPNIPESLKTPETSQKKIIKIKNNIKNKNKNINRHFVPLRLL